MTPAYIVEGKTEQKIIQRVCPGARVVLLECNGTHVKMQAVAKRVVSLFRLFGNRHYPVSVIFDREKRLESCSELEAELRDQLSALSIDSKQFRIAIADRKLETWLLYTVSPSGNFSVNCNHSQKNEFEGASGDYELYLRLKKRGIDYHKTTTGVDLFSRLNPRFLAEKSASFAAYIKQIDFPCEWVNPTKRS